jgi:hypothetical protein
VPPLVAAAAAVGSAWAAIGAVGQAIVGFGLSVGLSYAAKALSPTPKRNTAAGSGSQVTIREPLAARRLIYGRTRVGGTIVYVSSLNDAGGSYLNLVVALCEGPVDGIETVYFNDVAVEVDGASNVTTAPFSGYAYVERYTGQTPQQASPALVALSSGAWTTEHRLNGIAYLYVKLQWDQNVWQQGVPNVTATIRGRPVHDPRTTTTSWSENPALILRDFLLLPVVQGGVGAAESEIDEASFIAAANVCDELVPLAGGGVERRYAAGGVMELDEGSTPQAIVQSLLTACGGRLAFWGGKWRLTVAAWRSPTFEITEAMLRGPIRVDTRISRRDQFNAVKGSYREPADRYIARDYPAITSPIFEEEDGGARVYRDVSFDWTASASTAQRLAKIELLRAREPISVQVPCTLVAYAAVVGDVVTVTYPRWGWSEKTFEVVEVRWAIGDDMAPGIDLALRETSAAVFDWASSEQQLLDGSPATSFPDWTALDAPSFTLAAGDDELFVAGDGAVQSRIKVAIAEPQNGFIDRWEIRWKLASEAIYTDPISIGAAGSNVWWISPIHDGQLYDVEVRALTSIGTRSAWSGVYGFRAVGKTAPPPDVSAVSINGGLLRWDYPTPPADLAGFRVRYHSGSFVFWESGVAAHSGLVSAGSLDVGALLTGPVTLMVKAVDTSGNESAVPAVVVTDLGEPVVDNVVVDHDLRALGFPGDIAAGHISGGNLVGGSTTLFWSNDSAAFYRPGQILFWPTDTYAGVSYAWSYAPDLDLADATMSIFSSIAGTPWSLVYREGGTGNFWDGSDIGAFWTTADDRPFWNATGPYLPWPGRLSSVRRTLYEFRLSVGAGPVQPVVSQLRLVFDVPDIMETLGDVDVEAGGTRLPLTRTFRAITAVNLTVQAGANGAVTARIEDKALNGPLVTARTAAGTAVDATIDAIVQGY